MVPTLSQYKYVVGAYADTDHPYGDLDRILWDGEVMPLRTGDTESVDRNGDPIPRKNILRGEAICFLLEAYTERLHLLNFVPRVGTPQGIPNRVFRRRLDWNTIGGTDDPKGLIEGFNTLGSTGNLWVPETGRPLTGSYEAPFTLSDAWEGKSRIFRHCCCGRRGSRRGRRTGRPSPGNRPGIRRDGTTRTKGSSAPA